MKRTSSPAPDALSHRLAPLLIAGALAAACAAPDAGRGTASSAEALASWAPDGARAAIVDFVERTTTPGSPDHLEPSERIAVFDNDGTLWSEQPLYNQLAFALDRVPALAPGHPEWESEEPFASVLRGDLAGALAGGEHAILELVAATHSGMTPEEFDAEVRAWLLEARHPRYGRPYDEVVYQPMLELLDYLRANGYSTYIVSGGGVDFMRAFVEEVYGVPPAQVIGSTGKLAVEERDGRPVLVKQPGLDFLDDKEGKPMAIQRGIGVRPAMAFGNSDGDLAMIDWTTAGEGPRFGAFVHHDDGEREVAYDRESSIGRLARGLDLAPERGWTVISIERDWTVVFP
jgi:phosphoglycolate phosphatase-like HAD superfamily hydrolase